MSKNKFGIIASMVFALSIVLSPVASACSLNDLSSCDNDGLMALVVQLLAAQQPTTPPVTTPVVSGLPAGFQFNTNLKLGSTGNDVKYLQIFLNSDSTTAVGNAGSETSYFGSMTQAAVIKFQNKYASEVLAPYGLTAGTGFFGTSTRAKANAMIGSGTTTPVTTLPEGCTSTSGFSPITGQSCSTGSVVTLPEGCTSTSGFSPTTGERCDGGTTVVPGSFTVSLSANNPASSSVVSDTTVGGQALVDVLKFNISNPTGVTVTTLKVQKGGISIDADINNAYLYDGETRLAEMQSISNGVITFTSSAGLFTVPSNTVKEITVKVDVAKNVSAGKTLSFSIVSASDIVTVGNLTVAGYFPINGNAMTVASVADLGKLTVATVTDPGTTIDAQDNVELWRFSLQASNQKVEVSSIKISNIGSADAGAIQNLKLYDGDLQIGATLVGLESDRTATFNLSTPLSINSGVTKNISLRGDIAGGAQRTFKFSIQRSSDIVVRDVNYNISLTPNGNTAWSVIQAANTTTVNTGVLSVSRTTNSPSGNVALNGTNVTLAEYDFKATGENVKVNSLTLDATVTAGANIKNVRILVDGNQVGATQATVVGDGTDYPVNLGNSFIAQAGTTHKVTIVADITGSALNGNSVLVTLVQGNANGQGQSSLSSVNVPTGDKASNALTIATGGLTGSVNISIPSITVVKGSTGTIIGSFNLTAGAAEAINLNSVTIVDRDTLGTANGSQGLGSAFNNLKLMHGGSQVGQVIASPSATAGTIQTFNISPAVTIAAGQSARFDVVADVLSGATWNTTDKVMVTTATSGTGSSTNTTVALATTNFALQQLTVGTAGTLTVSLDGSSPAVQQIVMGATDTVLGAWKLDANNLEDLKINQIIVGSTTSVGGDVQNLKLFVDGVQVGNTVPSLSASTDGTATFGSSSSELFTISASTNEVVTLKGTVTSSLYATGATSMTFKITLPATIDGASANTIIARGAQSGTYAATAVGSNTAYDGNASYAYRTKLAATLNSASPSGTGKTRQGNDTVFRMDLSASPSYQAVVRRGALNNMDELTDDFAGSIATAGTWAYTGGQNSTLGSSSAQKVQGTKSLLFTQGDTTPAAGEGATYTMTAADLSAYNGIAFWVRASNATPNLTLTMTAATAGSHTIDVAAADTWQFVVIPFTGADTPFTGLTVVTAINILSASAYTAADTVYIDGMYLYKDFVKANINMSANGVSTTLVSLKDVANGTTIADGYTYGSATAQTVYFIPTTADLVVAPSTTKSVSLVTDTTALINGTANISINVGLGSSSSTIATPGDILWWDGKASSSVSWVNSTPNPVQGNALGY